MDQATMLRFDCENPECQKHLKVASALAGREIRCPGCLKVVTVPDGHVHHAVGNAVDDAHEFATETGDVVATKPKVIGAAIATKPTATADFIAIQPKVMCDIEKCIRQG